VQRAHVLAAGQHGVGLGGVGQGLVEHPHGHGVDGAVVTLDALDVGARQLNGADLAGLNEVCQLDGRAEGQFERHLSP
jgi:hypothetical protein